MTLADDFGLVGFGGFRETRSVSLAGTGEPTRSTIRRFDDGQDKLGHETRRIVYDRDKIASITDTSYVVTHTNDNSTKSFQVSDVRTFACMRTAAAGAEAGCIRENNVARMTSTWGAFKLSSIYVPPGGGVPRPPPPPIDSSTTTSSSTTTTSSPFAGASIGGIGIDDGSGGLSPPPTDGTNIDDPDGILLWVPMTSQRSASTDGIHAGDRQEQGKFMLYYAGSQYLLLPLTHRAGSNGRGHLQRRTLLAHDATAYDLKAHGSRSSCATRSNRASSPRPCKPTTPTSTSSRSPGPTRARLIPAWPRS